MSRGEDWIIPPTDLVQAMVRFDQNHGPNRPCTDNWGEPECTEVRSYLPSIYHVIESDWIRILCSRIRKAPDKFGYLAPRREAMGRRKQKLPEDYQEYLNSENWAAFKSKAWEFWEQVFGTRVCGVCTATTNLDIHHRTYCRFRKEEITDVIPLCRKHHDMFHHKATASHEDGC